MSVLSSLTQALNAFTGKMGQMQGAAYSGGSLPAGQMGPTIPSNVMAKRKQDYWAAAGEAGGMVGDIAGATGTSLGGDIGKHGGTIARAAAGDPTAILGLVKETISNFTGKMGEAKQSLGKAWGSETAGGAAAGTFESGQKFFESMGLFAKYMPPAKIMSYMNVLASSVDSLRQWNAGLHNANMKFSQYSGLMAAVAARQNVREIMLSMERGNRRAGSAEYLAEGMSRLESAVAPWDDAFANLKNVVTGVGDRVVARLLEPFIPLAERLTEWLDNVLDVVDSPEFEERVDASVTRAGIGARNWSLGGAGGSIAGTAVGFIAGALYGKRNDQGAK